jgi:uncharacterized protein YkwD
MVGRLGSSLAALLALVVVTACSDSPAAPELTADEAALARKPKPTSPTSPTPTSPTPTAPTTGATVTGCDGSAVTLSADEKASLDLHQSQRASSGLPAFCVHPRLVDAARAHSADMVARNYFSHTGATGESFSARVTRYGYTGWTALAENIAWGSGTLGEPSAIFNSWMNSSGHRANILNGGLREIGIGVASGTFQGYSGARVYTADFGTR